MERSGSTGRLVDVSTARARLGEGPVWDDAADALYWVDIYNHRLHRFSPSTGDERVYEVGDVVGCIALTRSPRLLLGMRHGLAALDPATGATEPLLEVESGRPGNRLNDGKCDSRGRLWIGSMSRRPGEAALYRVDPDGSVHRMVSGLTISNGLGWSPDDTTFYLTDSGEKTIHAYDFDADTGAISGRRVLASFQGEEHTPDGLTVDEEGCLWAALWDGWAVVRLTPDGREASRLPAPVRRPTSCTFGGAGLRDLYVTSGSVGLSEEEIEESFLSGDLFRSSPGVRGLPAARCSLLPG